MDQLFILVKTASRIDWVLNLAEAAGRKGKVVWIHFLENGVLGLDDRQIEKLARFGRVSICQSSADRFGEHLHRSRRCSRHLVSPAVVAEMVRECERQIVL